jgi:hypothetical protein
MINLNQVKSATITISLTPREKRDFIEYCKKEHIHPQESLRIAIRQLMRFRDEGQDMTNENIVKFIKEKIPAPI